LLGVACSDPGAVSDIPSGSAGDGAGGEPAGPTAVCPEGTGEHGEPQVVTVGTVSGQIVDEAGEPTTAGIVQVCGIDVCTNADVGQNGKFVQPGGQPINTPAIKFGDGLEWAKLSLPLGAGDTDVGTLSTVRLPDFADGQPLTPGTTVESGGVTLTLAPGAAVAMNILDYGEEFEQGFRAVRLPEAALTQLQQDFVVGYALSPLETRVCPSPALSLENSLDLPAGTELTLYALGLDADEKLLSYAAWQRVGEGTVSADGSALEFPEGLPVLSAIGVKVKE
jgi:hypothetical protein